MVRIRRSHVNSVGAGVEFLAFWIVLCLYETYRHAAYCESHMKSEQRLQGLVYSSTSSVDGLLTLDMFRAILNKDFTCLKALNSTVGFWMWSCRR